jgi:hypothetical protein
MFNDQHPLVASANGIAYRMGGGNRVLLGFEGAWMALTASQILGIGNTLGNILNCPFKARHLAEGMLLRSKDGDHRMPLTEESARELHGLVNDVLLLLDAESVTETVTID